MRYPGNVLATIWVLLLLLAMVRLAMVRLAMVSSGGIPSRFSLTPARNVVRNLLHSNSMFQGSDAASLTSNKFSGFRDRWETLRSLGVTEIALERFDPDAVVLMRPGPDMQPGIAALDDNANGIVDDPAELGATGSDDVCLVRRAGDGDPSDLDPSDGQTTLVLQHGAFVPATPSEPQKLSSQWRALVRGQSDGHHWSFLVEME